MLVTHQWTFLVNIGYIVHTFLILPNSSFCMNEPLKGTDCIQKRFDGILILPDKLSSIYELSTALFAAVTGETAIFLTFQRHLLLAENECAFQ